jgi:hypothetical protein
MLPGMRPLSSFVAPSLLTAALAFGAATLFAQEHHHHGAEGGDAKSIERLGTVSFPTSCSANTRIPFERGIALMHSFWYEEASAQFRSVAAADPQCAMAQWGIAMTEWRPLWDGLPDDRRRLGRAEIAKAQSLKPPSDREQRYVNALAIIFNADSSGADQATAAYVQAMASLHAAYPQDHEAAAFYALGILAGMDSSNPVGTGRRALAVLEPEFAANPNHPGFAHYIVHAADMPQLAHEGLPAAQRYLAIAPSSPHALHMPGHIFARLGMWPEDIASNEKSAKASEEAAREGKGGASHELHAYEFLFYAYLQEADDANARRIVEGTPALIARLRKIPGIENDGMIGFASAFQVEANGIYRLETGDNAGALAIEPDKADQYAREEGDWVHAIAAGRLRDAAAAEAAQADAAEMYAQRRKTNPSTYSLTVMKIPEGTISAWTSFARHQDADALREIAATADLQDRFGQSEVDIPVREMYADMLLMSGRPADALTQYRTSLANSPNRFNGLFHAAQAAEQTGDSAAALGFYRQLLTVTGNGAHSTRTELAHAREYLATHDQATAHR